MLKPRLNPTPRFKGRQVSVKAAETKVEIAAQTSLCNQEILDRALEPLVDCSAMPPLLSPPETAELLGVGIKTLERWRSQGGGPRFVKLSPGAVRYRATDLNEFINERLKHNTL